jgi:ATP-dependent helicase/nuclease subunit A
VGIFFDLRDNGLGDINLMPLDLIVNFRSKESMVYWCNTFFQSVFHQKKIDKGAVKHLTTDVYNPSNTDSEIETHLIVNNENIAERRKEADIIVDLIHKHQAQNLDDSIAILVRKRSQVSTIVQ